MLLEARKQTTRAAAKLGACGWLCGVPLPLCWTCCLIIHSSCCAPVGSPAQVTGGRNGYGAKLANIFSTKFVVETCDGKRGRRYKQAFSKNMSKKGEPAIT